MKKCECGSCSVDHSGATALETESCCCGGDHTHSQENHDHAHGESCGCGHEHGNKGITTLRQDIIAVVASALVAGAGLFLPVGLARSLIFVAAVLIAGLPIFWQGLKNIARLQFEEMSLMTIAVVAATIIGELPEALLVTLLFRIGNILEDVAVARSRRAVEAVTDIIPDNANLLAEGGAATVVKARELAVGSRILVKSGERVPVDSTVLEGHSAVDTSSLTGESAPREVQPGDSLLSGSVNIGGVLTCEIVNTFDNSTASKIIEMVRDSAAQKGRTERLISKFARVYTPIVIVVAVLVALVPPLLGFGGFSEYLSRALVFLVASCPCALVIAIPLSFFAGIGAASKNGILIKGSKYVEALAGAKAVVLDKTGTLTTGKLEVTAATPVDGVTREELLRLAALCESYSNHPIAKAVVAESGALDTSRVESCEELTALGMRAVIDGEAVLCGSARLMKQSGVKIDHLPDANLYIARGGKALGAIAVADQPREDAASTISALKEMGIERTIMLTGDGPSAARRVAKQVGIDAVRAELLPAGKVAAFEEIQRGTTGRVIFVGDGINDSPVIARADAGIAMGLASDAAIEAADVVLLSDRLDSLPRAIGIARRTSRLARFNIAFALTVKLAVFVLALFGFANMGLAVFADVGVTILSVLNATRALRF